VIETPDGVTVEPLDQRGRPDPEAPDRRADALVQARAELDTERALARQADQQLVAVLDAMRGLEARLRRLAAGPTAE
jgi:hypothetical protein